MCLLFVDLDHVDGVITLLTKTFECRTLYLVKNGNL